MNYRMILSLLGDVLLVIGAFLLLPCIVAVIYGEPELWVLLATAAGSGLLGGLFILLRPKRRRELHARDGFVMVALSWILISLVGAIPFTVSGAIPSYLDAVFETMSGFTTTGASILRAVEDLPKCLLFWRSFTHWLGGMGVLVFMLAIVPLSGESIYLLRAESPGPSVSKMVPKMRTSAAILYAIYCAMTLLQILFYRLGVLFGWGEMTWFDSLCLAFGTAGTGGFSVRNSGLADYSAYLQAVTTVFMVLFGVNFSVYFFLLRRRFRLAWHNSEVRWYFIIIFGAIVLISANLLFTGGFFPTVFQTIHHVAFSVGSVITTTGYGTADFAKWPEFSKTVLLILMAIGACAGSTGGGMKVSRVLILSKTARAETRHLLHRDERDIRVRHAEQHRPGPEPRGRPVRQLCELLCPVEGRADARHASRAAGAVPRAAAAQPRNMAEALKAKCRGEACLARPRSGIRTAHSVQGTIVSAALPDLSLREGQRPTRRPEREAA